jgi:DNA-binding NarL/FixJ family response regulator
VWEEKLVELIKNGGKSIRQIARELNVDSKTVKVYALKLGLSADEITDDIDGNENNDGKS